MWNKSKLLARRVIVNEGQVEKVNKGTITYYYWVVDVLKMRRRER